MSGSVELPLFHALKTCLHVQIAELLSAPKHQALQKQVVVIDGGVLEHLPHDPVSDRAVVLLGRFLGVGDWVLGRVVRFGWRATVSFKFFRPELD